MQTLRDFVKFEPGLRDHEAGWRCAVGVLVPLCTLMALGRMDLMVFAVFGAFTGVYGRGADFMGRLVTQTRAAGLMIAVIGAAMLGHLVLGHWEPWLLVVATTLVAGVCAAIAHLAVFRPSGSLFHIFAFAAISSLPQHPPLWQGMAAAGGAALLGILVGAAANYRPGTRPRWEIPRIVLDRSHLRGAAVEGGMNALVAGAAGLISLLAGPTAALGHTYWAMVAAVVPLQAIRARHVVFRGTQRVLGTLLGLIPLAIVLALNLGPWGIVAAVGVCQFLVEFFIVRHYLLAQMFVTPLALLSISLSGQLDPRTLLRDRIGETILGSLVGMVVLLAVRHPDVVGNRLARSSRTRPRGRTPRS
ncbi:FUSC family protein [Falsarthrobacter nasiphocae]|uniref:Membrane protein YccC n=1 Tax=Falsarthrobacter nasiphocae TaxID=189863 RepID=A0AAE3YEP8_9MICC|nr:FUSC family protein [Falsarthrobacter nasiphocae]MDR6891825.1 putative membrane protein YccC [Falsarthrobacter nasiphocae]